MARNATVTLTADQTADVQAWENNLRDHVGQSVTVEYTKRDGTAASITGTMLALVGATADKRAVTVETDKGFRSANLRNITAAVLS